MSPVKFESNNSLELNVIFFNNEIYVTQENSLIFHMKAKNENDQKLALGLEGSNCISFIQYS